MVGALQGVSARCDRSCSTFKTALAGAEWRRAADSPTLRTGGARQAVAARIIEQKTEQDTISGGNDGE